MLRATKKSSPIKLNTKKDLIIKPCKVGRVIPILRIISLFLFFPFKKWDIYEAV